MVTTTSITAVSVSMRSDHTDFQIAGGDELQQLDALLLAVDRDLIEGEPGQQRGDQHQRGGDDLRGARAGEAAERAREQRADQREEEDRLIHRCLRLSP